MKIRTILEYLLAAIVVLVLGGLAGWYFFLRTQTQTVETQSAARGFGTVPPEGNANGATSPFSSGVPSAGESVQDSAVSLAKPTQRPPQLWQVQSKPVAGQILLGSGAGLRLRYVERAGGYVFEANPETGQVLRLTNTLMPKIYEAVLTENGHVYARSLDAGNAITTFVGTIASTTNTEAAGSSAKTLSGFNLPKDLMRMSVNRYSGALFYLLRNTEGVAGVSADWNGGKLKTIFNSPIVHWQTEVLENGPIILVQSAADSLPGYAYELKKDGTLNPLLGPIPGLTLRARAVSGQNAVGPILWGQSSGGDLRLFVQVAQNTAAVRLPIRTIADKCAWSRGKEPIAYCGVPQGSPGQSYLDDWYRGATHSSDALWRINASAGTAEVVYTPPSNTPIDIENIEVDSGGNYIAFRNAADKSLWLLRLAK